MSNEVISAPQQHLIRVYGRVLKRRVMKNITFADLIFKDRRLQLVIPNPLPRFGVGDFIDVEGTLTETDKRPEFAVSRVFAHLPFRYAETGPAHSWLRRLQSPEAQQLLEVRSRTIAKATGLLTKGGLLQVTSPTIVGNWAVGQTGSFPVEFYEVPMRLSISNMLYHQILMSIFARGVFELSKIFRAERPSSCQRLAEFTMLDVGLVNEGLASLQSLTEELVRAMIGNKHEQVIPADDIVVSFDVITYDEVIRCAGETGRQGAQLSTRVRQWLDANIKGFVWISGFPEAKRPFFVKSTNGRCHDLQLWVSRPTVSGGWRRARNGPGSCNHEDSGGR